MIVGLTGGIATGKSTVAAMLVNRGAILIDADQIAREVVQPGKPVLVEIERYFAEHYALNVLTEDGQLDRPAVASLVFANIEAKRALESLIHPVIRQTIVERMQVAEREHPQRLIVVDIPLLFESKYDYMFAEVILVYVSREVQLARLKERDGLSTAEAEQRVAAQMPIDNKRLLADVIIDNSGEISSTEQQIDQYWRSKRLHEKEV